MYLKHSSDYTDSKYLWVHWFNSLGSSDFAEILFLALIALHRERKRCGQVGHSPVTPRMKCIFIPSFRSLAPMVFLEKIPFLAFSHYHGNHFMKFLAHVLSWVKTYHHAEFQRNSPTGLARMMVQTYRQTDQQTDRQTNSVFSQTCHLA